MFPRRSATPLPGDSRPQSDVDPRQARLRSIVGRVTDPEELAAIEAMIDELERRAKVTDNGDGAG